MERCPAQAVLPLVGLAAEKVIRDRYSCLRIRPRSGAASRCVAAGEVCRTGL
ncbi:MAG: hypothetical protein ACQESR_27845 [Planctomycetota bacterium]